MSNAASWPIPITTVGASVGGTVVFRKEGKLHVTCVLKSTFRFVPDKPMQIQDAIGLFRSEVHHRDNPTRSIRATSDVVPYLPRVDVVLTGHAYAPRGRHVKRQLVRLSVFHSVALLEKKLEVIGDRHDNDVIPFERMPLIYEKALGGLGDSYNPWGTGTAQGSAPPNITYPNDPQVMAGFGPISRALRQRKVLRGNLPLSALDENIVDIPDDFDWNYFQAAPLDQQIASLVGNEWIVLEGMNAQFPRIASRLPTVRPLVTVFGLDPAKPDVASAAQVRIDMLRIDADDLVCSVVARAVVPIENDRSLQTIRIVAAVETEDLTYAHMLTPPTEVSDPLNKTVNLVPVEKPTGAEQGTIILGDAHAPKKALPFLAAKSFEIEDEGTVNMDISSHHDEGKKQATPFSSARPKQALIPPNAPIPGAPWSPVPVHASKSARGSEETRTDFTMDPPMVPPDEPTRKFVKPEEAALLEALKPPMIPPAPIPELPPPPKAPSVVFTTASSPADPPPVAPKPPIEPTKDMWAKTGNELPIVTTKAPPPRIPAKPAVNKAIYGGFGPPKKKT